MAHDAAGPAAAALRARLLDQETRVRALLADIHRLQQPPPANAEDSSLHPHAHSRTHSPNVRTAASTPAQQSMALTVAMSSSPGAAVPACAVPYPPIPRAPRLSSAAPPIVTSLAQSAILSKPLSAASDDSPMADAASGLFFFPRLVSHSVVHTENGDNKTTVASSSSSEEKRRFRKTCLMIWSKLAEHRFGNVFTRAEKSAYYLSVIKNPTNLTMIKNRIRDGVSIALVFIPAFH
ncbi:hypothetical protein HDU83_009409 [Entophlyctis luteolus]|nr:hypothetical protein HDU83_009409 [Entophlyctis luteolus]